MQSIVSNESYSNFIIDDEISRMDLVSDTIKQLFDFIQYLNEQNTDNEFDTKVHIITFNLQSYTYDDIQHFNPKIFEPYDGTDFKAPIQAFNFLKQTLRPDTNIISMFLTDGFHNSRYPFSNEKMYNYAIGISENQDANSLLNKIADKVYIKNDKKDLEETLISSIFTKMQSNISVKISLIIPLHIIIKTSLKYKKTFLKSYDKNITPDNIPVLLSLNKKDSTTLLNIKQQIINTTNQNTDVIFVVDISGSMNNTIYDTSIPTLPNSNVTIDTDYDNSIILSDEEEINNDEEEINDNNNNEENDNSIIRNLLSSFIDADNTCTFNIQETDIPSVFDKIESDNNSSLDTMCKLELLIDQLDKYSSYNILFENITTSDEIFIEIEYNDSIYVQSYNLANCESHKDLINFKSELIIIDNALKTIFNLTQSYIGLKSIYIRELYSYINNTIHKSNICILILTLKTQYPNLIEYHVYDSIIMQINMLYGTICTVKEFNYPRLFINNDLLEREISTRVCRGLTQSNQTQSEPLEIANKESITLNKECILCCDNNREIIYNCGHIVACETCTQYLLYENDTDKPIIDRDRHGTYARDAPEKKSCPVCRQKITGCIKISTTDFQCSTDGCIMMPSIICCDCKSPTYCETCWSTHIKETNNATKKGKRKHTNDIICKCGTVMEKYIKALFI